MTTSHCKNRFFPRENEKSLSLRHNVPLSIFSCALAGTSARCQRSGWECYEIAAFCSHFIHTGRFPFLPASGVRLETPQKTDKQNSELYF
jgi:hypothetical protein